MPNIEYALLSGAGAVVGAAGALNLVDGVPLMMAAQSMQAGLGAGIGYAIGSYFDVPDDSEINAPKHLQKYLPLIGAAVVPYASGTPFSTATALLVVGAYVGAKGAAMLYAKV